MKEAFSIIGESGSGKTTLIEKLIKEFKRRKFKVCVIKHCHHGFDIDHRGKDSWRFQNAGADSVILTSPKRFALLENVDMEYNLNDLKGYLKRNIDIILIEGFRMHAIKKVLIYKNGEDIRVPDKTIAIYGDKHPSSKLPHFSRNEIKNLCNFLQSKMILKSL